MKNIILKCKIITPLIMGGGEMQPELREQSLKGMLRWWFRFYKGAQLDLEGLRKGEEEIFGSQKFASRIKIVIRNKNLSCKKNGQDYYAYLCMNDRKSSPKPYDKIKRKAFVEEQEFQVNFKILHPCNQDAVEKELKDSLFFLSNFGGLGARWRRGFGSVMFEGFQAQGNNLEEISQSIKEKIDKFIISKENNNFVNLSNTLVYLMGSKNIFWSCWRDAMDDLRDNFYRKLKGDLKIDKIAFGLPRAVSPLIIQIKKSNNKKYYGVILIWKNWEKYEEFVKKMKNLNFIIKEVKA